MATLLPRDDDNIPIPALSLRPNGAHAISATVASQRNATPFAPDTRVVGLYATEPVFVRLGDSTATATASDHYFPAGVYYDVSLGNAKTAKATHIAVIKAGTTDGTLYVSEKS